MLSRPTMACLAIGALLCFGAAAARAGDDAVTEDQIVRALAPAKKPLTRSLSVGPQTQPIRGGGRRGRFVQTIRGRATLALVTEREEIATSPRKAEDRSGDQFRLQLREHQRQIAALGAGARRALSNPDLKGSTFIVAAIPMQPAAKPTTRTCPNAAPIRSSAIWSTGSHRGSDLVTVGYGKSKLKDPANPMAEANRRVQVVNMRQGHGGAVNG